MREPVHGVPRDLLGEEPPGAGQLHDLRQGRGVAEGVGQPDLLALDPEIVQEELLADHELPGHRLAADHVGVGLDPHAADGHEPAGVDLFLHPLEELGWCSWIHSHCWALDIT